MLEYIKHGDHIELAQPVGRRFLNGRSNDRNPALREFPLPRTRWLDRAHVPSWRQACQKDAFESPDVQDAITRPRRLQKTSCQCPRGVVVCFVPP